VSRKVHAKYPSIGKSDKKKKSSSLVADLLSFAEEVSDSSFLVTKAQEVPDYGAMSTDQLAGYPDATLRQLLQMDAIDLQKYNEVLQKKKLFQSAKPPQGTNKICPAFEDLSIHFSNINALPFHH